MVLGAVCLGFASPACAQADSDAATRDTVTIALGAITAPRYEGSDENSIGPAAAIRGTLSGIGFTTTGTGLSVDLVPPLSGTGWKLAFGPVGHVTANRSSLRTTRAPQVVALGKVKPAVELGAHVGLVRTGVVTSAYDSLDFDVAVMHDVTGIHAGTIVTPSVSYGTPLSRKAYVGVSVSADYVGSGYAQTYFGVDAAQSLRSGLPVTTPGDGFKDLNFGGVANLALTGDLRRGLSAFALGNYTKMLGAIGRSPVVRDRSQLYGAIGLAYTF